MPGSGACWGVCRWRACAAASECNAWASTRGAGRQALMQHGQCLEIWPRESRRCHVKRCWGFLGSLTGWSPFRGEESGALFQRHTAVKGRCGGQRCARGATPPALMRRQGCYVPFGSVGQLHAAPLPRTRAGRLAGCQCHRARAANTGARTAAALSLAQLPQSLRPRFSSRSSPCLPSRRSSLSRSRCAGRGRAAGGLRRAATGGFPLVPGQWLDARHASRTPQEVIEDVEDEDLSSDSEGDMPELDGEAVR